VSATATEITHELPVGEVAADHNVDLLRLQKFNHTSLITGGKSSHREGAQRDEGIKRGNLRKGGLSALMMSVFR
jgi:hypothetical protein